MPTLGSLSRALVLLILFAHGPAHAGFIVGGKVNLLGGLASVTSPAGIAFGDHNDGFGNLVGLVDPAFPAFLDLITLLPVSPAPGPDLSQSFTSALGTSSSQVAFTSSITNVAGNDTLIVSAVPGTAISLSQTDLSPASNGPALLRIMLGIPFTFASVNPTQAVFFDLNFDVTSNIPALTSTDSLLVRKCLVPSPTPVTPFSFPEVPTGFLTSDTACTGLGGSAVTLASLGAGTALPASDPVAGWSEVVDTDRQYAATFAITLQIKNDTGPTTLSLENFTLTMSAVPEPSVALLMSVGLLGLFGSRQAQARA